MRTFLRIVSLGLFAAAGIGLAICVGFSTDAPAEGRAPADGQPPELVAELSPDSTRMELPEAAVPAESPEEPTLPPMAEAERRSPWPPLTVLAKPLMAGPLPG